MEKSKNYLLKGLYGLFIFASACFLLNTLFSINNEIIEKKVTPGNASVVFNTQKECCGEVTIAQLLTYQVL
jgi:hypothetical protein